MPGLRLEFSTTVSSVIFPVVRAVIFDTTGFDVFLVDRKNSAKKGLFFVDLAAHFRQIRAERNIEFAAHGFAFFEIARAFPAFQTFQYVGPFEIPQIALP